MKINPSEIINEFQRIYISNDSARSKPNRYRSVLELLLKYLLDIPRDEYHPTSHLVSHVRTYNGAFKLSLPSRTRRLNEYFNVWSHANSSEFDIAEFHDIENELRSVLEEVLEISITAEMPLQKIVQSSTQKVSKPSFNMTKSEVLEFIEHRIGQGIINRKNFKFSNINKGSGAFWLNIPSEKFEDHLDIGLIDREYIIWIRIEGKSISNPSEVFATRNDNGKIDLNIDVFDSGSFLIDRKSQFNFMQLAKVFPRNE